MVLRCLGRAGCLKNEKVQKQRKPFPTSGTEGNLRHSAITWRIGFAGHRFEPAVCLILFSNHTACARSWQLAAVGAIGPVTPPQGLPAGTSS